MSTDEAMEEGDTAQASSMISELYVSDDMTAFKIDRHLSIQQKLRAKDPSNNDIKKILADDLEQYKSDSLTRIFISNAKNTHPYKNDTVAYAIISEFQTLLGMVLSKTQMSVTQLGRTGPFVVALQSEYARTLIDEGAIELVDTSVDPFAIQTFSVKSFEDNAQPTNEEQSTTETNMEEPQTDKMTFSIFFNLPVEYTGLFDDKKELEVPKRNNAS
mmetsp:Transcript_41833/g.73616  ORF Transcript_41833/g.73616 Transcript_41833/m.73616 type:complete len:216 (+) Transcript_41833:95-742(+)